MDFGGFALNSSLGCEVGHFLECVDIFRAAIWVAAIVERVHADEDVMRADGFGIGKGEGEENCVARGDVGGGDFAAHA